MAFQASILAEHPAWAGSPPPPDTAGGAGGGLPDGVASGPDIDPTRAPEFVYKYVDAEAAGIRGRVLVDGAHLGDLHLLDATIVGYMLTFKIPNCSVAVVSGDGDGCLIYVRGFTWIERLLELEPLLTTATGTAERWVVTAPETPFRIGSLTRSMTAAAIHALSRNQPSRPARLKLTDSVVDHPTMSRNLPRPLRTTYYTQPTSLSSMGLSVDLDRALGEVQVQNLLRHTAGWMESAGGSSSPWAQWSHEYLSAVEAPTFERDSVGASALPIDKARYIEIALSADGIESRNRVRDWVQPADGMFQYSNLGYALLGRIIEQHCLPFDYMSYMRRNIWLSPYFGMEDTGSLDMEIESCLPLEARYYAFPVDFSYRSVIRDGFDAAAYGGFADWSLADAGGSVRSSAVDMAKWVRNLRWHHPPRRSSDHPMFRGLALGLGGGSLGSTTATDDIAQTMWNSAHGMFRDNHGLLGFDSATSRNVPPRFHTGSMSGLSTGFYLFAPQDGPSAPSPTVMANAAFCCFVNRTEPGFVAAGTGPWGWSAAQDEAIDRRADTPGEGPNLWRVLKGALSTLASSGAISNTGGADDDLFDSF